jgi:pyrroline-5-carboxylate reductase
VNAHHHLDTRVGVIGAGVMAEAVVAGLLAAGVLSGNRIVCSDPSAARRELIAKRHGVEVHDSNRAAAAGAGVVLLCVKPQALARALRDLRGALTPNQLVISIVAGAGSGAIGEALHHDRVVRAMPNTPAQIGQGVTAWFAGGAVEAADRGVVRTILGALGQEVEVADEAQMAMATAVSGSGPAYVFLFAEAMIDAAVHLGLARSTAVELVLRTVRGSADFALASDQHISALRGLVTSPGGTTAAALQELERGAFRGVVGDAVSAAFERTIELESITEKELTQP